MQDGTAKTFPSTGNASLPDRERTSLEHYTCDKYTSDNSSNEYKPQSSPIMKLLGTGKRSVRACEALAERQWKRHLRLEIHRCSANSCVCMCRYIHTYIYIYIYRLINVCILGERTVDTREARKERRSEKKSSGETASSGIPSESRLVEKHESFYLRPTMSSTLVDIKATESVHNVWMLRPLVSSEAKKVHRLETGRNQNPRQLEEFCICSDMILRLKNRRFSYPCVLLSNG
ncbi:hypothetical protein TGDOM2_400930 [Toxoplasma gondii GAB2-2007-GAL-DOM2]|uniref:Uncharacterized protein n=1 Tax=Toxoplasma gondii GAB2-2007-GAL-DOM2 TaxID=1130820 RepID=A0A086JJF6_TOXGO|nr:hypothetical protein TGDOM2_400930 [Toxoplasma gondii GAB2-2007-GAL-DOM2]